MKVYLNFFQNYLKVEWMPETPPYVRARGDKEKVRRDVKRSLSALSRRRHLLSPYLIIYVQIQILLPHGKIRINLNGDGMPKHSFSERAHAGEI